MNLESLHLRAVVNWCYRRVNKQLASLSEVTKCQHFKNANICQIYSRQKHPQQNFSHFSTICYENSQPLSDNLFSFNSYEISISLPSSSSFYLSNSKTISVLSHSFSLSLFASVLSDCFSLSLSVSTFSLVLFLSVRLPYPLFHSLIKHLLPLSLFLSTFSLFHGLPTQQILTSFSF